MMLATMRIPARACSALWFLAMQVLHCNAMARPVKLTAQDFDAVVRNGTSEPWFVYFYLTACKVCPFMSAEDLGQLAKDMDGKVRIGHHDLIADEMALADRMQMGGFPRFKLFKNNLAYTYFGELKVQPMKFFLDPPRRYLGWEICPKEEIAPMPTLAERIFTRRGKYFRHIWLHKIPYYDNMAAFVYKWIWYVPLLPLIYLLWRIARCCFRLLRSCCTGCCGRPKEKKS